DLAQAGAAAVEQRLIEANLCRRHLSRLDLVRSFETLLRVARNGRGRSRGDAEVKGDLRDLIARRVKPPGSGRTLDRWPQVLHMPLPIRDAVDSGRMKLTDALRVAALDPRVQAQVAGEIAEGATVKEVLVKHLARRTVEPLDAGRALDRLVAALERAGQELSGRIGEVERIGFSGELDGLREGQKVIQDLITRVEANLAAHAGQA